MQRGSTAFDQADILDIQDQLPKYEQSSEDFNGRGSVQRYLDFYAINFTQQLPELDITYRFGSLDVGEFKLACQTWRPLNARRSVILVHGYYDHTGIYGHIIEHLLKAGCAVLCFDLPGHGLSSGERAAIESFDHYAGALLHIYQNFKQVLPGELMVVAQSTGCAAVMNLLLSQKQRPFSKIVLLAPLVAPQGWRSGQWFYRLLNSRIETIPRKFAINSHDAEFLKFLAEKDLLQPKVLSVEWIGAMKQWLESFKHYPIHFDELLVVQGSDDKTVDWEYNLPLIKSIFPKTEFVEIEGGRHQLVNEAEEYRQQVFSALDGYLQLTSVY